MSNHHAVSLHTVASPAAVPGPAAAASFAAELPRHLPSLERRALQLTRNPPDARDLVQDTVARALRFSDSFRPGSQLRAWLDRIMTSLFISRLRRRGRERRALEWMKDDPCAWLEPEPLFEPCGLTPNVQQALDALPRKFSQVVQLVDLQECSYRDAAARLGVPIGTVMSRLSRARRMLASALADTTPLLDAA